MRRKYENLEDFRHPFLNEFKRFGISCTRFDSLCKTSVCLLVCHTNFEGKINKVTP